MGQHFRKPAGIGLAILCAIVIAFATTEVRAASIDDLRQKISDNNRKIEDLQRQIDQYSNLLNSTSKEATTLKNALAQLELTQKKLEANLKLTSTQISKTALTLEELGQDISAAKIKIASSTKAMGESLRDMRMAEDANVLEELLKNKSISETWDYVNALHTVGGRIKMDLVDLKDLKELLEAKQDQALGEKAKLESYRKSLSDQTKVVASNKEQKDKLLKDTQNKEAVYKTILAEKNAQKAAFEKELFEYESQLKVAVDPSSIPSARSGILAWPLDKVVVTQYFGKTVAAKRLYTSGTHGGIDFKASVGTKVKAALSGTVVDTEAYKTKSGCQYGKWVLIKHPNGLTSIYGHLSVVSVQPGDTVITGDTIGYSGETGYATGPHLHFGVYASGGIKIVDSSSLGSTKCAGIKTVAANPTAYLDPSAYLPKN